MMEIKKNNTNKPKTGKQQKICKLTSVPFTKQRNYVQTDFQKKLQ